MAYFLRYTNTASKDLQRGTSLHCSGLDKQDAQTKGQAAKMLDIEPSEITFANGVWCQILNGLCGYLLEASTIEEAIEEVFENERQFAFIGRPVIFSGKYSNDSELVPDGDLFIPFKIEAEL